MQPTTTAVASWLRHIAGVEQLKVPEGILRLSEAVELNKDPIPILSTYGQKEFRAVVGFIDMRGFSQRARGLRPIDVAALVRPFIAAVIEVAKRHLCIIDKTIGDEVMVIMPEFGEDTVCAGIGLEYRGPTIMALASLVTDIAKATASLQQAARFSSAFAYGSLVIDHVGADSYAEWTCYGNVVNAAKRIQTQRDFQAALDRDLLAVGAIDADEPDWAEELRTWAEFHEELGPLRLLNPSIHAEDLKGVGTTTYLTSEIECRVEAKD